MINGVPVAAATSAPAGLRCNPPPRTTSRNIKRDRPRNLLFSFSPMCLSNPDLSFLRSMLAHSTFPQLTIPGNLRTYPSFVQLVRVFERVVCASSERASTLHNLPLSSLPEPLSGTVRVPSGVLRQMRKMWEQPSQPAPYLYRIGLSPAGRECLEIGSRFRVEDGLRSQLSGARDR